MKIHLIVAHNEGDGIPWIVDAWDEYTEEENPGIREELFASARTQTLTDTELREAIVHVSDGFLMRVFEPVEEGAESE